MLFAILSEVKSIVASPILRSSSNAKTNQDNLWH